MPPLSHFSKTSDLSRSNSLQSRSRLRYPLENKMEYPARIIFRTIETIPPDTKGEGLKNVTKRLIKNGFNSTVDYARNQVSQLFSNSVNTNSATMRALGIGGENSEGLAEGQDTVDGIAIEQQTPAVGAFRPTQTRLGNETVELYLPPGIQFNDMLGYDDAALNVRGSVARSGVEGGSDMFSTGFDALQKGFSSIADLINGTGSGVAEDAARAGVIRSLNLLPGVEDIRSGVKIGLQTTLNPNTKSVFRNVNLRQFNFSFKFIATSARESQEIEKIIKFFRKNAYPEHIPSGTGNEDAGMPDTDIGNNSFSNVPLGFTFPNRFRIAMRVKNKEGRDVQFGYKIKPCVLRTTMTNYNSSGMSFHDDGKPFEIELNLGFQEFGTLSRSDIEKGF